MVTFKQLAKLEPRLKTLFDEAKRHRRSKAETFCANAVWYGYPGIKGRGLKERLVTLVGFELRPRHDVLSTMAAYNVAYDTIYKALPDCRGGCACTNVWKALVGGVPE